MQVIAVFGEFQKYINNNYLESCKGQQIWTLQVFLIYTAIILFSSKANFY